MFYKAYDIANKYTLPLVVAMRFFDETIDSGLGSFVVLNDEGWLVTAAHNLGAAFAFEQHQKEIKEYHEKIDKINSNQQLNDYKRKVLSKTLKPNPKWITDFAIFFSAGLVEIKESFIYGEHDIAFLKVDAQVIKNLKIFPKIKNSSNIRPGTSLCKLGFPFINVSATFDPSTKKFSLPPSLFPVPLFPIEGIYTRNVSRGKTLDGSMDILFLETSSPGLKGQSGGPIFDTDGNIYAIQSQNITSPLGFKGLVEVGGKKIEENQFINFGIGVHTKTLELLLKKHNIKYETAN